MIMKQLVAVLRFARPSSSVLLAFDGPAPLAKMITQRQRRAKSSRGWSSLDAAKPSPLHATPGTSFMARAEAAVLYVCYSELGSARGRRLSFYLSVISRASFDPLPSTPTFYDPFSSPPTSPALLLSHPTDMVPFPPLPHPNSDPLPFRR